MSRPLLRRAGALAIVALLAVGPGSLVASASRITTATGSITCVRLSGTVLYHPAVRHVGTGPERQEFIIHAAGCTTSGSNVKKVAGGTVVAWLTRPSNACADLLVSAPVRGTGTWTPRTIRATTARFSGYAFVTSSTAPITVRIPNPGGHAVVTGSFAGRDHGARSSATGRLGDTPAQFVAACRSAAGLRSERIVSGRATFS